MADISESRATIAFWRLMLRKAMQDGVDGTVNEVLKAVHAGVPLDIAVVDAILRDSTARAIKANTRIYETSYTTFFKLSEPDFAPLRLIIDEKNRKIAFNFNNYKLRASQAELGFSRLGRQSQDIIRRLTLNELQKGFIKGNPSFLLSETLPKKLLARGLDVGIDISPKALTKLAREFPDKVPIFSKRIGTLSNGLPKFGPPKFWLHTFPYNDKSWKAYDVDFYADLVALTTTDEARWTANEDRARRMGTRFIRVTKGKKSDAQYRKANDEMCARINGKTFSIDPEVQVNGVWGAFGKSGRFYAYIRDLTKGIVHDTSGGRPGGFAKPHPFCTHQASPLAERFA